MSAEFVDWAKSQIILWFIRVNVLDLLGLSIRTGMSHLVWFLMQTEADGPVQFEAVGGTVSEKTL